MSSLTGKTVVVTRAREQAREFAGELEAFGARVVLFPTVEIVPPASYDELDQAIENVLEYDWIVFTSANAVEHFLLRFGASGKETFELDELRLCAVGEATAERMTSAQLHVDVLPADSDAAGVFAALADYLGADGLPGVRFLLPRSEIARETLPAELVEAGAVVTTAAAYRTVPIQKPETGKMRALLQGGAIDCITFTSSSTCDNFVGLFDKNELPQLLEGVAIACIGETTARTAREHNLAVNIVPTNQTVADFAQAVADYYQND